MFAPRIFPERYFSLRYFGKGRDTIVERGAYFSPNYYNGRYFSFRYFGRRSAVLWERSRPAIFTGGF